MDYDVRCKLGPKARADMSLQPHTSADKSKRSKPQRRRPTRLAPPRCERRFMCILGRETPSERQGRLDERPEDEPGARTVPDTVSDSS